MRILQDLVLLCDTYFVRPYTVVCLSHLRFYAYAFYCTYVSFFGYVCLNICMYVFRGTHGRLADSAKCAVLFK